MKETSFKLFKFQKNGKDGKLETFKVPFEKGMRVLDALKFVQETIDPTLSFRWNCRVGTCGSCAVRVNGSPKLACKTEVLEESKELIIEPLKTLDVVKDLLTDTRDAEEKLDKLMPWFDAKNKGEKSFELFEEEVLDVQEMKKCIHCYACFDVCPVVRAKKNYIGPKAVVNINSFEMHPKDVQKRIKEVEKNGLWNCIMSGCCSDVCPQEITIAENAIPYAKEKSLSIKSEKNE